MSCRRRREHRSRRSLRPTGRQPLPCCTINTGFRPWRCRRDCRVAQMSTGLRRRCRQVAFLDARRGPDSPPVRPAIRFEPPYSAVSTADIIDYLRATPGLALARAVTMPVDSANRRPTSLDSRSTSRIVTGQSSRRRRTARRGEAFDDLRRPGSRKQPRRRGRSLRHFDAEATPAPQLKTPASCLRRYRYPRRPSINTALARRFAGVTGGRKVCLPRQHGG